MSGFYIQGGSKAFLRQQRVDRSLRRRRNSYSWRFSLAGISRYFRQETHRYSRNRAVREVVLTSQQRMFRLSLLCGGSFVLVVAIVCRLWSLQGEQHKRWLKIASNQHETSINVQGARGSILDRWGRALAVSVPAVAVGAHPRKITKPRLLAHELAPLLGKSEAELYKRISVDKSFVWLAREVPHDMETQLISFRSRGISCFPEFRRSYPQGMLASSLMGRVGTDGCGLAGIELGFESSLHASDYTLPVRRDARGRFVNSAATASDVFELKLLRGIRWPVFSHGDEVASASSKALVKEQFFRNEGGDLLLSLDSFVQSIIEEEFDIARKKSKARRVFGLVLDAKNGEVLGVAQNPGYDPNTVARISLNDLRNVIVQDSFEPGSTLKPLVAALALEHGVVSPSEVIDCEKGHYRVGSNTIRDAHPIGLATFSDVLVRSSNIGMTKVAQRMGKQALWSGLRKYGFGSKTGIELPGESRGILRSVETWRSIDIATHSFGQGIAVTALQLVRAYGAVANGGLLIQPTILLRNGEARFEQRRILRAESAASVAVMLRGVVEDKKGTGKRARIPGLAVFGKTGTAQKARENGRGYDNNRVLSSFVGFVDGSPIGVHRTLVMLVVVDEPDVRPRWGGTLAAPAFKRSMERIFSYLLRSEGEHIRLTSVGVPPYEIEAS